MAEIGASTPGHPDSTIYPSNSNHRRRRPQSSKAVTQDGQESTNAQSREPGTSSSGAKRNVDSGRPPGRNTAGRRRKPRPEENAVDTTAATVSALGAVRSTQNRRRANFGSTLTNTDEGQPPLPPLPPPPPPLHVNSSEKAHGRGKRRLPQGEDLTSTLIREMSIPPFLDCPICFSSIRPEQPIWSCSPSIPIIVSNEAQIREYCWTAFHLKCIRSWAEKSVKEVADAWRARGELNKKGDWRCPGCQAKREIEPSSYWCFCNSMAEPKRARLSTPHSCGSSCSRPRESGCGHPCTMRCHPGPCPPCQVMTQLTCYCPRQKVFTLRCGTDGRNKLKGPRDLSCGNPCGRTLDCGKHACQTPCHDGLCDPCGIMDVARCCCGKEEKQIRCGEGEEVECVVQGQPSWIGMFACDKICGRSYECGKHSCEQSCHPPSFEHTTCPHSPSQVQHCPCGKQSIAPNLSSDPSEYTFAARVACSDPIPTCESICSKQQHTCDHHCLALCHDGPCPPCNVEIVLPCRCGGTTRTLPCFAIHSNSTLEEVEILCEKPCKALRACGKHQCRRICCPLASLSMISRKGKKRAPVNDIIGVGEEQGGLHECDLVCGKLLSCGKHKCERKDHKGPCPSCLMSSFEELICPCGRTVYEPPIPCGTNMICSYPCPRPRTTCEHQNTPHDCHDDEIPCPPCVHLTEKMCACGKRLMTNVRCSLESEKVSCGGVCGRKMSCGFHHCERLCHSDACGSCTAPCGKSRKLCLPSNHPCTQPCHAPSACAETEPCPASVTLTCPCGQIKKTVHCGRTAANPSRSMQSAPKCSTDCHLAKRNAKLAEALGIDVEAREKAKQVVYGEELLNFAKANGKFLALVEKALADFVNSEKQSQILPHMSPDKRKFVHDLAIIYRVDTQMVDPEPRRCIQLYRRMDTRIPNPPISTYVLNSAPNLGKLGDLRTVKGPNNAGSVGHFAVTTIPRSSSPSNSSSWRSGSIATPPSFSGKSTMPVISGGNGGQRGWAAIVKPTVVGLGRRAEGQPLVSIGERSQLSNAPTVGSNSDNVSVSVEEEPTLDNWEDDDAC